MMEVEGSNIPVVDEGFLEDVSQGGNPLSKIAPHTISSWGAPRLKLPKVEETDSAIFETGLSSFAYIFCIGFTFVCFRL